VYGPYVNEMDQWQIIARAEAIPMDPNDTSKGALIPIDKFMPVLIDKKQRRSFYVTMNGPYLDYTANALQKSGELHRSSDDMNVLVGAGFSANRFPESGIDTSVDPQFAGVIHYKKNNDCDKLLISTSVVYNFLFNQPFLAPETPLRVNTAIDETVELLLEENPVLNGYKQEHGLHKLLSTKTDVLEYNSKFLQKLLGNLLLLNRRNKTNIRTIYDSQMDAQKIGERALLFTLQPP
jgi:hypothetical protein